MSIFSTIPTALVLSAALFTHFGAPAAVLPACDPNAVTLTSMVPSAGGPAVFVAPPPVPSTTCVRGSGNDTGTALPGNNRGQAGDGLLNGANGFVVNNLVPNSDFLDLDNNGSFLDPGWIRLGGTNDAFTIEYETVTNTAGTVRSIEDFLKLTFSQNAEGLSGTWGLTTNVDIVSAVQAFLGRSTFDHLAIILKGGNNGYVVYDFNFKTLAGLLPPGAFDFNTAYSFTGDWATTDLLNTNDNNGNSRQAGLSHISFWARDPISTDNQVPEPGTVALIGVALAGLGMAKRLRR